MNKSESIQNLAAALAKFQEEIKNPANSADNPFFKSKYAPLNDVLNLVRPILTKHGLSVLQSPSGDGQNIIVTTLLLHSSGEWIETEPLVLKADKPTAQGAGSAITYARRYAISAVLGISSEDDDDGNHATGNDKKEQKNKPKDQHVPFITDSLEQDKGKEKYCQDCNKIITDEVYKWSMDKHKRPLCKACQYKDKQKAKGKEDPFMKEVGIDDNPFT